MYATCDPHKSSSPSEWEVKRHYAIEAAVEYNGFLFLSDLVLSEKYFKVGSAAILQKNLDIPHRLAKRILRLVYRREQKKIYTIYTDKICQDWINPKLRY